MFISPTTTQSLHQLRQSIHSISTTILSQPPLRSTPNTFLHPYTIVYQLCNTKPPLQQMMLEQYKSTLVKFIDQSIETSSNTSINPIKFSLQFSHEIIQWFNNLWLKYVEFMTQMAKKIFVYLDRHYLPGLEEGSLHKIGIKIFLKNVCQQNNMQFYQLCYFKQLLDFRDQKLIINTHLYTFTTALALISPQLVTHLTSRYIQQSTHYYTTYHTSQSYLPPIQYYNKIYNCYLFQLALFKMTLCLNMIERTQLLAVFENTLVKAYTQVFIDKESTSGMIMMFRSHNVEFMKIVTQVYTRFEGFERIRHAYYELLLEEGDKIISSSKQQQNTKNQPLQLVDSIYTFYKSHLNLLTLGFHKNNELLVTLNNATQKIITRHDQFIPILYKYCSTSRLTKSFQHDKEKITILFDKISSKDQFIALYQNEMFLRYINNEINLQEEAMFVNYLNEICGSQLTLRLVKKITEFGEMLPMQKLMSEGTNMNGNYCIITQVNILSLQLWQKQFIDQISLNITLPQQLADHWRVLQKQFIQQQPKKKLIPLPFQNKLQLEVKFNKKKIIIKCHLIQAAVLIFLASKTYCSEEQLILNLSLEKNILQATIQTLQTIPNLLLKTTLGDYIVNWYYDQSESHIDLIAKTPELSKYISKTVKQDREILVQAAIVKFAKRQKTMMFQDIAVNVVKAIRLFKPQPSMIKAGVEKLVKKGFIQEKDNGVIEYVE